MSLFEPQISNFVVTWEGDKATSSIEAKIKNNNGEKIGSIISKGGFKRQTYLLDSKDSRALTIFHGLMRDKFEIKDSNEKSIGIAKEKSQWHNPYLAIEDLSKKEILEIKDLSRLVGTHDVISSDKTVVAELELGIEEFENYKGKKDHRYTCNFQIFDQGFDKKILWGSFLSFLNAFYTDIVPTPPGG